MSFWGRLFGTEEALGKVVDHVANGLDALIYTDEEKATDAAADRSEARKMVVGWMVATQGQNLARRLIALSITGTWLGMYLISTLAGMVGVFLQPEWAVSPEKMKALSDIAFGAAVDMNPPVMLILAFYFAAPHMGDIAKAVTGRFTNQVREG